MDGAGSGTVFNGPSPALDAMYTSTNNYITGTHTHTFTCYHHACFLTSLLSDSIVFPFMIFFCAEEVLSCTTNYVSLATTVTVIV